MTDSISQLSYPGRERLAPLDRLEESRLTRYDDRSEVTRSSPVKVDQISSKYLKNVCLSVKHQVYTASIYIKTC